MDPVSTPPKFVTKILPFWGMCLTRIMLALSAISRGDVILPSSKSVPFSSSPLVNNGDQQFRIAQQANQNVAFHVLVIMDFNHFSSG